MHCAAISAHRRATLQPCWRSVTQAFAGARAVGARTFRICCAIFSAKPTAAAACLDQWNNLDNSKAHYESTGPFSGGLDDKGFQVLSLST
jgi:hypothetical protein